MSERIENNSSTSLIGFCGVDCGECKAFIATQENDAELKKTIAEEWSKYFGHQMKPEDMTCVGCTVVEGPHVGYCAACEIRNCGLQKKVQNCGYCLEYGCDKLNVIHDRSPKAKAHLEEIQKLTKKK